MSNGKNSNIKQDAIGAGTLCSKCRKICYITLWINRNYSDATTTSDMIQHDHIDCAKALCLEESKLIKPSLLKHLEESIKSRQKTIDDIKELVKMSNGDDLPDFYYNIKQKLEEEMIN